MAAQTRPRLRGTSYMTALTAVLGTTISPYLFFWQASKEVEEQKTHLAKSR
jgi:Mn2+/Fe2+ NRAMP family transporter